MQTGSGAFATAVVNADQTIAYLVQVTFPGGVQASFGDLSNCVETVEFYRQVTSSLPAGSSLIAGYSSVQPKITLSGLLSQGVHAVGIEGQTVYWLFNPNDPTSPMWRQTRLALPITIKMGLYDPGGTLEVFTEFTGTIDQIDCSDGLVTLTCLDRRSTMTNLAALPPVITGTPFNAGLTSEYAIDYLARHASPAAYYSWPPQRANCLLAVSMRSSIWPEVGSYAAFTQSPEFTSGVFGSALSGANTPNLIAYQLASPITPSQSYFVEGFVSGQAGVGNFFWEANDATAAYGIIIEWESDGNLHIFATSPGGSLGSDTIAISPGDHYVALLATWPSGSGTVTCHVNIDGTVHAFTTSVSDTRPSNINFSLFSVGGGQGTVEGVQVTTESAPTYNNAFSPTLTLDPAGSLNALTALPDVTGKQTWTVLQDIATAEAAVIGFNELGKLQFTNRQTIKTATSARSITSSQSLATLDSSEQMSLAATHIQCAVNALTIGSKIGVWNATSAIEVSAGTTLVLSIQTQNIVVNVDTTGVGFWPLGGPSNVTSFRACTTADGTGTAVLSGVTQTVAQLAPTQLAMTIVNSNGFPIWMVSPGSYGDVAAGFPFLFIAAQPVTSATTAPVGGTTATNGALIADAQWPPGNAPGNPQFGAVLLPYPANDWIQDLNSAQTLVDDLLSDLFYPRPQYQNVTIVPDPRLQLLDRVTLVDPDISQLNADVLIVGIDTNITNGVYTQTLDVRAWARPGAWLLGVAGSSELGVTTFIY